MEPNEIIDIAEYTDIVIKLLSPPYEISSITKLVFIAFCVKHENNQISYRNRTKDFVDVFFTNISLKLSAHYEDIKYIINTIDLLYCTSKIVVDNDYIALTNTFSFNTENPFLKFCSSKTPNPIVEINKLDAKALLEEVLRYV